MKFHSLLAAALLGAGSLYAQSHGHINAGAIDSNNSGAISAGDKLFMYFEHGTETTNLAANGGAGNPGLDGYNWNGFTTFTALHQSSYPSEAPNYNSVGALSGSYLVMELVSISGPVGAQFAFYDSGATDPTWVFEIGTGFTVGTGQIQLTEDGWFNADPSDPYGHIHGRTFGVNMAGIYTATWILRDLNTGTTGLLNSDQFTATYNAVPEPGTWALMACAGLFVLGRRLRSRAAR